MMHSSHKRDNLLRLIALVVAAAVVWELIGRWISFLHFLISTPASVFWYAVLNHQELLAAFAITGLESIAGLCLAFCFAILSMIVGLYSISFYRWMLPAAVISQVIPLVSLAPFFILAFGLGFASKIAMAATMCFFPIFVNLSSGVMSVPQSIKDLLFVYAFSQTQAIFRVYLPLSLPSMFAGLRIAATLAVIGAIVAEFNGAERGLGKNLFLAAKRLEPELMMASLALSSLLGGGLFWTINLIERHFGRWYIDYRPFHL
jgi:NitT/TauT family transport system permease protein